MKKVLIAAALTISALGSTAQISQVTDIDDLALIYIGSQHRPDWNKELLYPYVVHEYADGTKSWMYDGFLMIEFAKWNDQGVFVSFGEAIAPGSQREDWEDLLDEQLGTKTGNGCRALDELIGEQIPLLGEPGHKHKVVLTLPIAEAKSGNTWGEINGRRLNFDIVEDRIEAEKWYVDRIVEKWNEAGFRNIELDGIYWIKEAMPTHVHHQVATVNDYIHSKGLKIFWIPYHDAPWWDKWSELGMDVVYLQPNYYQPVDTPIEKLEKAITNAWDADLGLEVECEGYNFSWDPKTGERRKFAINSTGLYGHSPVFYQRLVDYIDKFEENEVFVYMPMAYYMGFEAVYDFMTSGNAKDREIMDRLARLMNRRHVDTGWDTEPSHAGISEVTATGDSDAYAVDGGIYLSDSLGGNVSICSADGRIIYTRSCSGLRLAFGEVVACERGVYVVRSSDKTIKVAVK